MRADLDFRYTINTICIKSFSVLKLWLDFFESNTFRLLGLSEAIGIFNGVSGFVVDCQCKIFFEA